MARHRQRPLIVFLTIMAILGASCSAGTSPSVTEVIAEDAQIEQPDTAAPAQAAEPATIDFELDELSTVRSTIGPRGGELITTSGETQMKLVIPAGALDRPTEITMTPLSSAESNLVDLTLGGAQFTPSGLVFTHPASLEMTGPNVQSEIMAVRWERSGGEVVPTLAAIAADGMYRIPIAHFSGAGAGTPKSPGLGSADSSKMGRAEAIIIDEYRSRGPDYSCIEAGSPAGVTAVNYYIAAAVEEVIPALKEAQSDDLALVDAARRALDWWAFPEHQQWFADVVVCQELVDAFREARQDYVEEISARLTAGFTHAIYESVRQCRSNRDFGEVRHMVQWHERAIFVLAIDSLGTPESWGQLLNEAVEACATFRVEFRTQLTLDAEEAGRHRGTISATASEVPEASAAETLGYRTEHRFAFNEPSFRVELPHNSDSCVYEDRSKLGPMVGQFLELAYPLPQRRIPGLSYQEDSNAQGTGEEPGRDGRLVIDPLETSGSIVAHCEDITFTIPHMSDLIPMWFNGLYKSEWLDGGLEFHLTRENDGSLAASFSSTDPLVDPTDPSSQVQQDTEIRVHHTPVDLGPEPAPPPEVFRG